MKKTFITTIQILLIFAMVLSLISLNPPKAKAWSLGGVNFGAADVLVSAIPVLGPMYQSIKIARATAGAITGKGGFSVNNVPATGTGTAATGTAAGSTAAGGSTVAGGAPVTAINYPAHGNFNDIPSLLNAVLVWGLGFMGALAVLAVVYSGFMYITAGVNTDQAEKAKKNLTWAIIGVVLIAFSGMIVFWINENLNH